MQSFINIILFNNIKIYIQQTLFKRVVKYSFIFIIFIVVIINLKLIAFDIFKIPSSSMENTLFPNDVIVVNKLKYGPRLPRSPFDIPLVNMAYYFNDTARKRIKEYWWPYKRLSGMTTIKQGDVMVFNSTWRKDFILVKRCVALPGDTLNIKDTKIYTNNNLFTEPNAVRKNYKFKVKNKTVLYKALDSFSDNTNLKNSDGKFAEASLTSYQLGHLKKQDYINSVKIQVDTFVSEKTFVKLPSLKFTFDNMGPITIPNKGLQIVLNKETFSLYEKAINSSEGCKIKQVNNQYYIDGIKVTSYTFKNNYYFMMGDNREGTLDSRRWGFIPESHIISKVQCVLYSNYQDEFQWDRLFKSVN